MDKNIYIYIYKYYCFFAADAPLDNMIIFYYKIAICLDKMMIVYWINANNNNNNHNNNINDNNNRRIKQ